MPDIELLDEIIAIIEDVPESWKQDAIAIKNDCGTAFCVAGFAAFIRMPEGFDFNWHASAIYGGYEAGMLYSDPYRYKDVLSFAQDEFGLGGLSSSFLFYPTNTLDEIKNMRNILVEHNTLEATEFAYGGNTRCSLHWRNTEECTLDLSDDY